MKSDGSKECKSFSSEVEGIDQVFDWTELKVVYCELLELKDKKVKQTVGLSSANGGTNV